MTKENKAIVRKIEKAWDTSKLDILDDLFSEEWKHNSGVPGMPPGLATAKMAHQMSTQAMPDRKMTVEGIWSEGDKVAVLTRMTGTNKGGMPWFGAGPNDAEINASMISIYHLKDGKIVETWGWFDAQTIMQQLGVLPAM